LDKLPPIRLVGPSQRAYAKSKIDEAPDGWIVTLREPTRTLDQNAKLWAMLGDLSKQMPAGILATAEDWKCLAMHACGWECQFMNGLDGRPFPIGFRSSRLTVKQMRDLIEWLYAYGAEHEVRWSEPMPEYAA
jgi:hypothetical protein